MNQNFFNVFERWLYPKPAEALVFGLFISSLLYFSYATVLYSGGTYFAYLHLFYIPIILSGFVFSTPGGVIVGLISSLLIGPFMPLVVADNIAQPSHSWIIRCVFFVLIGTLSGLGSAVFRAYLKSLKDRYLINSVTGLPNYIGIESLFQQKIQANPNMSLMGIHIRNLDEIGLALGPRGIDKFLITIALDLTRGLPPGVTLGHTQASVFILLIEKEEMVDEVVKYCQNHFKSTYSVDEIPVFAEEIIGIANYPRDDDTFGGLFRKVRMTINYGEKQGKVVAKYDDSIIDPSAENTMLLTELKDAIEHDTLSVYYQPKVNMKTGKVEAVEALTRWIHPSKGMIEPTRFIPLTERTMLINPFTKWLLKRTLKDMAAWEAKGRVMNLAVNFSMRNFLDRSVIDWLFELIEQHKLDPSRIEIEITESALSDNLEEVIKRLNYIRARGVRITIDDFGTGQASQQYLFQLPIDAIKIDRIFIQEIEYNTVAQAIVQNAISLGQQMKHSVTAEGIETQGQYDMLAKMSCELGQGFLIAKPLPFNSLMSWLDEIHPQTANSQD